MILTVTLNPAIDLAMEVPTLDFGEMVRAGSARKQAAGKGINVSRVLRVLGEPTTALTILGQGSVGEFQNLAREAALPIVYVLVPGETRTNIHIQEAKSGRSIKVNQSGLTVDKQYFEHFTLLFQRQLRGAGMVCLGGSLPPGLGSAAYGKLVDLAVEADVPTIIDTEGPALLEAAKRGPLVAKPNRRELSTTFGRRLDTLDDVIEAARDLQALGAKSVVITDSGERVICLWKDAVYIAHPPRITIKGTLGAGDSFAAGLAHALIQGRSFEEAITLATATGAAACLTSDTHSPRLEDILRLRDEVVLERL